MKCPKCGNEMAALPGEPPFCLAPPCVFDDDTQPEQGSSSSVLVDAIRGLDDEGLVRAFERGDLTDVARALVRAELLRRLANSVDRLLG